VVVVLGKIAFDSFLKAYKEAGKTVPIPRPKFGHGIATDLPDHVTLICSYHPSQQNTFTGKLTQPMFYNVFAQAKALL
jgi:uracil-DNA glycosylase